MMNTTTLAYGDFIAIKGTVRAFSDATDRRLADLPVLSITGRRSYLRKHPPMLSD